MILTADLLQSNTDPELLAKMTGATPSLEKPYTKAANKKKNLTGVAGLPPSLAPASPSAAQLPDPVDWAASAKTVASPKKAGRPE